MSDIIRNPLVLCFAIETAQSVNTPIFTIGIENIYNWAKSSLKLVNSVNINKRTGISIHKTAGNIKLKTTAVVLRLNMELKYKPVLI